MKGFSKKQIGELLREATLRLTKGRVAVLGTLLGADKPMTQEQIGAELGSAAPNKVTIYRILEGLIEADLVHRAYQQGRSWYFEPAGNCSRQQCHPHFTCTGCGDIYCMPDMRIGMVRGADEGFVVHRQRIELEGLCPSCKGS